MGDSGQLSRLLVDHLTEQGALAPEWRSTFLAVPRHAFIPDTMWQDGQGDQWGALVPLYRNEHPETWLELAYTDAPVVTQVDDGHPTGDGAGRNVSSSASMPTVVAGMLTHLDARPGHTVLEIGTGTGYNAALLAHRLGARNVTSIEVDEQLAEQARRALKDAGYQTVTVVTGDGGLGHAPNAPYDRVLSTAACQQVPYAWVEQTRPGGRIVTPWSTDYYNGGLLALTVADDGTASGRIVDKASFMRPRDQRSEHHPLSTTDEDDEQASLTDTDIHPADIANGHVAFDACIAIGIQVPRCNLNYAQPELDEDGEGILWLTDHSSGSWARLHHHPDKGGPYRVYQLGSRRLWDEVESAYRWWVDAGSPTADQWTFSVDPKGQHVWLADQGGDPETP